MLNYARWVGFALLRLLYWFHHNRQAQSSTTYVYEPRSAYNMVEQSTNKSIQCLNHLNMLCFLRNLHVTLFMKNSGFKGYFKKLVNPVNPLQVLKEALYNFIVFIWRNNGILPS